MFLVFMTMLKMSLGQAPEEVKPGLEYMIERLEQHLADLEAGEAETDIGP